MTSASKFISGILLCSCITLNTVAQNVPSPVTPARGGDMATRPKPGATEVYFPIPKKVVPATTMIQPPPDAIILLSETESAKWVVANKDHTPVEWTSINGEMSVKGSIRGNIETAETFKNYQMHIEFKIPEAVTGTGQDRGNGGIFLASTGPGDAGYEMQILDSYSTDTYTNGMGASIYKQFIPATNASLPAGRWQTFDIAWLAPTFNSDGSLATPARATIFQNGILVHNNVTLQGETTYIGAPSYRKYDRAPIKIQNRSGIAFRNMWIREVDDVSYSLPPEN